MKKPLYPKALQGIFAEVKTVSSDMFGGPKGSL